MATHSKANRWKPLARVSIAVGVNPDPKVGCIVRVDLRQASIFFLPTAVVEGMQREFGW